MCCSPFSDTGYHVHKLSIQTTNYIKYTRSLPLWSHTELTQGHFHGNQLGDPGPVTSPL